MDCPKVPCSPPGASDSFPGSLDVSLALNRDPTSQVVTFSAMDPALRAGIGLPGIFQVDCWCVWVLGGMCALVRHRGVPC